MGYLLSMRRFQGGRGGSFREREMESADAVPAYVPVQAMGTVVFIVT